MKRRHIDFALVDSSVYNSSNEMKGESNEQSDG